MILLSIFYKAGELVLDTCASTLATAKAYLQLTEHQWFDGYEKDSALFQDAHLSLVELFAIIVLSATLT